MSRHPNTIACALARVVLALVTLAFAVHADEPTAAFETSVTSGLAPLEVTFTDLSTGEVESWSWSFGDGTVSTEPSPTHVFEEPGSFTVKLTVTGPDGSDSVEVEDLIVVTAPPPVANFTTENAHGTAPLTVAFTDASDGWIDTWSWDFGDGETSTEQSPVHVYANPGQYTIRLTVTGPGGTNTRVRAGVVRALVPAPIAEPFATPTAGRAPLVVQFEDRLVGEATSWSWDFGDGAGSQSPAPTHTYDRGGSYTVTLAVTGPGGVHEVVLEETIVVQAMAPVAQVRVPKSEGRAPLAVQFNDESEGEIERWSWEFGDGETSNQSSPEHVYSEPGDYVWTLEVEGPGGVSTTSGEIHVEHAPLEAAFESSVSVGEAPLTVLFKNLSTGPVTSYQWSFGDGGSSTEASPVHVFEKPGVYDVSLSVSTGSETQVASVPGLITVNEAAVPSVSFGSQVRIGEAPLAVTFDNQTTGSQTSYLWEFGDGTSSTERSPTHAFEAPGQYDVTLTVSGPGGTSSQTVSSFVSVVSPLRPAGGLTVGDRTRPALAFSPNALSFGAQRFGSPSAPETVSIRNTTDAPVTLSQLFFQGADAGEFQLTLPGGTSLPLTLDAGGAVDVSVTFDPSRLGEATAMLRAPLLASTLPQSFFRVSGVALDQLGRDLRVNAVGTSDVTAMNGDVWVRDFGDVGGTWLSTVESIAGTDDDALYQNQRRGPHFAYRFPLIEPGVYEVRFHFAEIAGLPEGARIFDVSAEGEVVIHDLDILVEAGGLATALVLSRPVEVLDGSLDLDFSASLGDAAIAAIEVRGVPFLDLGVTRHDFGAVASGATASQSFSMQNRGVLPATPTMLGFSLGDSGTADSFSADFDGSTYAGTSGTATFPVTPGPIAPGASLPLDLSFAPLAPRYDVARFFIEGDFEPVELEVSGLGGHEGDPYLHVVLLDQPVVLDYDGDGSESVVIDGSGSHTHEPGRSLSSFLFEVDGQFVSDQPISVQDLALGSHTIELTILDDGSPQRSLTDSTTVEVRSIDRAPGMLLRYFDASASDASTLIDALPSTADFAEVVEFALVPSGQTVGGSTFTGDVVVELMGGFELAQGGNFAILPQGGVTTRLIVDGQAVSGPVALSAGPHTVRASWAVDTLADLPLSVTFAEFGTGLFDPSPLFHDLGVVGPVISSMTSTGSTNGGNLVVIEGIGFFPTANLVLHWGGQDLFTADFEEVTPTSIRLRAPGGPPGPISVTVQTPRGTSNARTFTYDANGPVPIQFQEVLNLGVPSPTAGAFGPDGRFYTTALSGELTVIEFDAAWQMQSLTTYPGVSGLSNSDTTGIAFDPYDDGQPIRVYVAHGEHYANGGSSFTGSSSYSGQVSMLLGPTFDTPVPVVTNLPVSNHDHSINALLFDEAGDLLISVGSMTNAGVRHPNSGDLPESPLSAAIVKARLSDPNFDGVVRYVHSTTGAPNFDQVDGGVVDLAPGGFVEVYARGVRHAFDMVETTRGLLYATDNGPNIGFGAASTGPNSESPDPFDSDELLLIERGLYYGSPNRNRGRVTPAENVYRESSTGASIPHEFRQRAGWLPSSTNGIDEYRSDVFGGAMRGDLVVQHWRSHIRRVVMSEDGREMLGVLSMDPYTGGLALETGPGGALLSLDYTNGRLKVLVPVEPASTDIEIADISPWRVPATGGKRFVIAGRNFGTLSTTSVTIGGLPATLESVDATRIVGSFPARPALDDGLLDVVVSVNGASDVHEGAVKLLAGRGVVRERWHDVLPEVPVTAGEVATGELDGVLYLVGEGTPATLRFDMETRTWLSPAAQRPYVGDHHAMEIVGGKLYLIGGFQGGSEGRVQIYDPVTDTWAEGTPMSWAGGSVMSAVIGGKIYVAGGIVNTWTVNNTAVYDPALDTWTSLNIMPAGRNHAAFGTDGQKLYVFGGREGGNWVQNGFANVQIYDPATDSWENSDDASSSLSPLPVARGGMGHAVFFEGEFFVIGGETQTGAGALPGLGTYTRVDVYDVATNSWREATPMPTGRHGIDPFLYDRWIFVAGGGRRAGYSNSGVFEGMYLP